MPTRTSIDEKLSALDALAAERDRSIQLARIKDALGDRHYRVAARAARLAADGLLYELVPDLMAAYPRFIEPPAKRDPNCMAKNAIARALVNLECDDAAFFVDGLRYRQHEPVWGGSIDTAVDVRCSCAMGLVATGYARALVELAALLHDPEADARAGAARAIACGNPHEAELLLRAKVLAGDADGRVIGECFTGLLGTEPEESLAFVACYMSDPDEVVRELAALALGESRLEGALEALQEAWNEVLVPADFRRVLLRAAAMHRSEPAFDWLASLIEESSPRMISDIVETLAPYKSNAKL
ncbi:MAG: HEAT repeat domain-containing protein, partial [Nitrococcus sp.]|nr:HEAT repeat domain-containing protein [Nitrococcus sp.]